MSKISVCYSSHHASGVVGLSSSVLQWVKGSKNSSLVRQWQPSAIILLVTGDDTRSDQWLLFNSSCRVAYPSSVVQSWVRQYVRGLVLIMEATLHLTTHSVVFPSSYTSPNKACLMLRMTDAQVVLPVHQKIGKINKYGTAN